MSGDVGGRRILLRNDDSALVETGNPGVLVDVDTPQHLQELEAAVPSSTDQQETTEDPYH